MRHAARGMLIGLATVVVSSRGSAQDAVVVKCKADFAPLGPKVVEVEITRAAEGRLKARLAGKALSQDVKASMYAIRPIVKWDMSVSELDAAKLNPGETSLLHLHDLMSSKEVGGSMKIPFDLKAVARMREYDLQGSDDEYGGTVLMEAYDRDGKLLGRALRALMANGCF